MNLGLMTYDNGILTISNDTSKMYFPIDEEGLYKIIKCVKQAYINPDSLASRSLEIEKQIAILERKKSRKAAMELNKLDGYVEIMHVDGITLFVKCLMRQYNLFAFRYISDRLPNTHGSTQVNITIKDVGD